MSNQNAFTCDIPSIESKIRNNRAKFIQIYECMIHCSCKRDIILFECFFINAHAREKKSWSVELWYYSKIKHSPSFTVKGVKSARSSHVVDRLCDYYFLILLHQLYFSISSFIYAQDNNVRINYFTNVELTK